MNREEMISIRAVQLSMLGFTELADMIIGYFEENSTMPGEKSIKTLARAIKNDPGRYISLRDNLIKGFASVCVKEVKLTRLQVSKDSFYSHNGLLPATALPMRCVDDNTYEMTGQVSASGESVYINDTPESVYQLALIPDGFRKNHPGITNMEAAIHVTDHTNGKFKNLSCSMIIDLGQKLTA